ncbi:MAG TPA: hypothetical protein VM097_02880 [Mycobacteriales bacterium]|nr:hypothetical protein [Mycobacteriales bacterium]
MLSFSRRIVAVAAVALILTALPVQGMPRPHVVDPRGDWPVAAQDIVSATFATVGKGRVRALQITLELAGPPQVDAALYWEVGWRTPGCALSYIEYSRSSYAPGDETAELIQQCVPGGRFESGFPATGRLTGSTIVMTTPLRTRFPVGTVLSRPYADSWTFALVAPGVWVARAADSTARGRSYRVGASN